MTRLSRARPTPVVPTELSRRDQSKPIIDSGEFVARLLRIRGRSLDVSSAPGSVRLSIHVPGGEEYESRFEGGPIVVC